MLELFDGCSARAMVSLCDTVRWRVNAALMVRAPGAGLQSLLDANRSVLTK